MDFAKAVSTRQTHRHWQSVQSKTRRAIIFPYPAEIFLQYSLDAYSIDFFRFPLQYFIRSGRFKISTAASVLFYHSSNRVNRCASLPTFCEREIQVTMSWIRMWCSPFSRQLRIVQLGLTSNSLWVSAGWWIATACEFLNV